jgi:hypothetical protein
MPVAQKYITFTGSPPSFTKSTTGASAPALPARKIAIAGMMVMKIPANSFATSMIGNQLNSLALRVTFGVSHHDAAAISSRSASRARFCKPTST